MSDQSLLARRAFDGVAAFKRARDVKELEDAAAGLFAQIGLPSFALARFFLADASPETSVLGGRFESSWANRYIANRYAQSSLIARELFRTTRPYSWDDVMTSREVSAAQIRIRNEARECGLSDGLFTPFPWFDGSKVAVVLAGRDCALDDMYVRISAEVLSSYYGSELRRLLPHMPRPNAALSPRQRECLAWVRQGKSSADIGDILGIAADTVEEHIRAACLKLGVRTRIQAAVEASLRGWIDRH